MGAQWIRLALLAGAAGCSTHLPQVPANHPACENAPPGQTYTTPAVLEVKPFVSPPNAPSSQPHSNAHQGMPHMDHGGAGSAASDQTDSQPSTRQQGMGHAGHHHE